MNKRLIFVDDEADIIELYRVIFANQKQSNFDHHQGADEVYDESELLHLGYEVDFSQKPKEAIQLITQAIADGRPYAGGFFDIRLGDEMGGVELVRRIKLIDPEIFCCMITGDKNFELTEFNDFLTENICDFDYLEKPFSEKEIFYRAFRMVRAWEHRQKIKSDLAYGLMNLENELHLRLAQIGELAGSVRNEVNDPIDNLIEEINRMRIIIDQSELTQANAHELKRLLDKNRDVATHVRYVVNSYLQLANVTKNEAMQSVSVSDLLDECRGILRYHFKRLNVELRWPDQIDDLTICCQRVQILHVLLNLLTNALQAVRNRIGTTWVELQVKKVQDKIEFRISDNGTGISDDIINRIFDPHFSTKDKDSNSGMGLAISRQIISKHNGDLELDRNSPHTCFVLKLNACKSN